MMARYEIHDDHMREEREAGEMADYRDIEREALEYMGEHAGDWDVDAVVREVMGMGAGSIDDLDPDEWTEILQRHDGEGPGAGKVFDDAGWPIDFGAAVELMDDGLREEIHMRMAPCSDQRFMDAYAAEHERRFGEGFPPYCNGEW